MLDRELMEDFKMAKPVENAAPVYDINKMTETEINAYLRQRKVQQSQIALERGKEARKDVENYVMQKYGLTLAQVWMAGGNVVSKTYKNPANNETYVYSGRGKVPGWLKGPDNKPNPAFEFRANGAN